MSIDSIKQHNTFALWFINHFRSMLFGLGEIIHKPIASFMTLVVIGIAFAMPLGLYVFLQNFHDLSAQWDKSPRISLYLKEGVNDQQIPSIVRSIKQDSSIATVEYISPQQGMQEFTKNTEFGDILNRMKNNPLPGVITITTKSEYQNPDKMEALLKNLQQLPFVDTAQLNISWVKRLFYVVQLGKRLTYALTALFALGVLLIIGNTIRLSLHSHRDEINLLKLIGATNAFIRRPLLYRGFLYGLFGGIIACILVSGLSWWLAAPANDLAQSYSSSLAFQGVDFIHGLFVILASGLLGLIGSFLAVQKYL